MIKILKSASIDNLHLQDQMRRFLRVRSDLYYTTLV